ncbi:hypothetical protein BJX70DRAFT_395485 [Aspergillus crustosus]
MKVTWDPEIHSEPSSPQKHHWTVGDTRLPFHKVAPSGVDGLIDKHHRRFGSWKWIYGVPGFASNGVSTSHCETEKVAPDPATPGFPAQITNGVRDILVQAENKYFQFQGSTTGPEPDYMQSIFNQLRSAGIVALITSNDAFENGYIDSRTGKGAVDIYGYDKHPIGVNCSNAYNWPPGQLRND